MSMVIERPRPVAELRVLLGAFRVLDSGEELDYPLEKIADNDEACASGGYRIRLDWLPSPRLDRGSTDREEPRPLPTR